MEPFEVYAERVISNLSAPTPVDEEKFISPLEGKINEIKGELEQIWINPPWDTGELEDDFEDTFNEEPQKNIDFPISKENTIGFKDDMFNSVENSILASGMESLAFYKSIHYKSKRPFPGQWGIFIFDYALEYLSNEIANFYSERFSPDQLEENAFWLLYFHERFHFNFDAWVISQESATGKPLYENYRNSVYRSMHPSVSVYEETLANLHALSSIARFGIHQYAKEFMLCQPGAYSNIIGIDRDEYKAGLGAQLFHGRQQFLNTRTLPEHIPYLANPKNAKLLESECPVFIVSGVSASHFVVPNVSLPTISEIENSFLKRYLNGIIKRTDHNYYVIDNGEKVKCPNPHKKTVKIGEFTNIVKKAGLTIKEYFDEKHKTRNWKKNVPRTSPKPSLLRSGA